MRILCSTCGGPARIYAQAGVPDWAVANIQLSLFFISTTETYIMGYCKLKLVDYS